MASFGADSTPKSGQPVQPQPAPGQSLPGQPAPGQSAMSPQQTLNLTINPAAMQQQPRYVPIGSYSASGDSSKNPIGTAVSALMPGGAGSQSKISKAIQNLTGYKRGQPAPGSQLDKANSILEAVMGDPRWQEAEANKREEQVAKNGKGANQWDTLSNTVFHSVFNAQSLGTSAMSGDINAIQDDSEKALMTILKDIGGTDGNTEKLLLAALHFKTTGVDLTDKIGRGENKVEKGKNIPPDDVLTDKPKRASETMKSASQFMDPMGFATFVGWNHDFSDGNVDLQLNRPTLDKEVIFKGADPMGHMGETLKALRSIDPSATAADAYDLSYHDIVGNLLSGAPAKLDTKKLVTTRLEKLGAQAGGEKEQGVKKHLKAMLNKVGDVAKKNPELAAAMSGATMGGATAMATGCPFAGMTIGMGTAMMSHNKLKE